MKKLNLVLSVLLLFAVSLYSQSAATKAANRKTAERCLKLAENCVLSGSWNGALNQAELGLSYDDSVSDLYFVKANAEMKLGFKKAEALEIIQTAFEKDNWVNYNKNSARILYGDLLSDTKQYEKALEILNESPFIYSADADFIRIKTLYRTGTSEAVAEARNRLSRTRKIYPEDTRFPKLFFIFETTFLTNAERNGLSYTVPDEVQKIAENYIVKFPDYDFKGNETELLSEAQMEVMASMFSSGEKQQRLLKGIGEKNQKNPLFAVAALRAGVISEEKAYNLFFDTSNNIYPLVLLEDFCSLIKDENLLKNLFDHLNAFDGTLVIDEDLDLCSELIVKYERGRAQTIYYDKNNDEILEMLCSCDYGVPECISYENSRSELNYDIYPAVKNVKVPSENAVYTFLDDDFAYTPFEMLVNPPFKKHNVDFYVPYVSDEAIEPDSQILLKNANSLQLPVTERNNAFALYRIHNGVPVLISFYDGNQQYGYANLEAGYPFVRYVDYDNDGIFETSETYDYDEEEKYTDAEDKILIENTFGKTSLTNHLYLKKVEIDRDNDTIVDFKEEYTGNGGKISSWDTYGNGIWDYVYYRYARTDENEPLVEETMLYNSSGTASILITSENGIPVKLKYKDKEFAISKGTNKNYYWISEKGTVEEENGIYALLGDNLQMAYVQIVQVKNHRFSVIRSGDFVFLKQLPDASYNYDFEEFVNE